MKYVFLNWELTFNQFPSLNFPTQRTALHQAAKYKSSVKVVRALLEAGAKVNARDSNRYSPLHFAAEYSSGSVVRALLDYGAEVNARDSHQCSPLHLAASWNSGPVLRELIEGGAEVNSRNSNQYSPLHNAACHNPAAVSVLLENNAEVDLLDKDEYSPLFHAAKHNQRESVIALCNAGANPHLGKSPLIWWRGVESEMRALIRNQYGCMHG